MSLPYTPPPLYTPPYMDPNLLIFPAVFNVQTDPTGIYDLNSGATGCTPAEFSLLWGGWGQGTVTMTGTPANPSINVIGACWIDFVFDHTWNFDLATTPDPNKTPRDWRPIGVAFQNTNFGARGDVNLPVQYIQMLPAGLVRWNNSNQDAQTTPRMGSTLRIYDTFAKTPVKLSFSLFVQYSDCRVAKIDPDIENDNEN